ncbi:MAG TPA: lipopolysaccharide kinase InaA family protein [Candidatus Binataceae bacterium]|nr:lipopolysaccharide kinase InaA family protein [Candidatus Binataceae bacterium]
MTKIREMVERDGWSFRFAEAACPLPPGLRAELVERALGLAAGAGGEPLRRSRHASTYYLCLNAAPAAVASGGAGMRANVAAAPIEMFVKLLDAPRGGPGALRALAIGSRGRRLLRIAGALEAAGFAIAPVLMMGEERRRGRTLMVTERVAGLPLPRYLLGAGGPIARKRDALRALGEEIARMHRAGFLHGDLTPYNIFVAGETPVRFVFIDHERTVRARLAWRRRRLRNLVQLCRFERAGMSRTDRLRIVDAYARAMGYRPRRLIRRLAAMLRARWRRDAWSDVARRPREDGKGWRSRQRFRS